MKNKLFYDLVAYFVDNTLRSRSVSIDEIYDVVSQRELSQDFAVTIIDYLLQEKIVTTVTGDRFDVTPLYFKIIDQGGWHNYTKSAEEKEKYEKIKLIAESKMAQRKLKLFWPMTIIALASGIITIVLFFTGILS
jgi:hypothetical protein